MSGLFTLRTRPTDTTGSGDRSGPTTDGRPAYTPEVGSWEPEMGSSIPTKSRSPDRSRGQGEEKRSSTGRSPGLVVENVCPTQPRSDLPVPTRPSDNSGGRTRRVSGPQSRSPHVFPRGFPSLSGKRDKNTKVPISSPPGSTPRWSPYVLRVYW